MANIDPIGHPEKPKKRKKEGEPKIKKGEPQTEAGKARLRAAQRQIEADRKAASLGGGQAPYGPARTRPRQTAPWDFGEEEGEGTEEQGQGKQAREQGRGRDEQGEEKERLAEKPEDEKAEKGDEEEGKGQTSKDELGNEPTDENIPQGEKPATEIAGPEAGGIPETAAKGATAGEEAVAAGEGTVAAGKGAATAGGGAATAGGGAVAAGGTAAGGIAAAEAETGAATGGTSCLVQIIAAIIIGLIIGLLILIIIFIFSQLDGAGRSPKQEPNPNSQADMTDRGKAIANADGGVNSLVQAKGMEGDSSYNTSKKAINDATQQILVENKSLIPRAWAATELDPKIKSLAQELSLNLEVMQSGAADDVFVAKQTEKIAAIADQLKQKTESCQESDQNCQIINENSQQIISIMDEINQYTFTKKESSLLGKQEIVKSKPATEINPIDLQYINDNKIDIRILRFINHLGESGWDRIKISRIVDFDQSDNESNVENEDEATVSAHNSGQALDITIVGTYKCSKYWGLKDFRRPCYVYYQTGFRPNSSSTYGGPNGDSFNEIFTNYSFEEALNILGSDNTDGTNWSDLLVQAGINALLQETGLTPAIFEFPTTDFGFGAYAFGESLGIDPNVFGRMISSQNEDNAWAKLGAAVLAQSLNLPSGSFEGSNTEEILKSIANAYVRKSLGIERTSQTSDFSPQSIGAALVEKVLLTRDPDKVKERLRLSDYIVIKNLNLPPDITSSYLSGSSDFNQFITAVGTNELAKLAGTYAGAGLERALGIPQGSWGGVSTNNGDALKRVGAAILARYILMDEDSAYRNPDAFVNNIEKEGVVNINTIKQVEFAQMIKGQESEKKLKIIADNYMQSKNYGDLNFAIRDGLSKNNISYSKLVGDDFKSIFSPEILKNIINSATNSLLERSVYSYQANFGDYTMSTGDIERIKLGDLSSVAYKMAGGIFDRELGLPVGFTQAIIENRESTQDIMTKAGIALLAQALGVNIQNEVLNESWYGPGIIPARFAQIKIESNGFAKNSFSGSIDDVIAANSIKLVVSALGLDEEEFAKVRANQADDYIKSKLYGVDAALGLPNGTAYSFAFGSVTADQVLSSLASSLTQTIQTGGIQGLATKLGLDSEHLPAGDLLGAFLGRDIGTIVNFFSSLSDRSINQELLTSADFFSSIVSSNDISIKNIVANEGIKILSKVINNREAAQIANIFVNDYINGNPISISEILKRSTGITNNNDIEAFLVGKAKSALSYWGVGQITNAVNQVFGNIGITYEQARVIFEGDTASAQNAYQAILAGGGSTEEANDAYREVLNESRAAAGKSVSYAYLDLGLNRLDSSLPYGTSKILIDGTSEERTEFFIDYFASKIEVGGVPLSGNTVKSIMDYFDTGDFDELSPEVFALADRVLGLPTGTVQTVENFIQNNGEIGFDVSGISDWADASFDNWFEDQTGFDIGAIVNIKDSIINGQLTFTGDPETIVINFLTNWLVGEFGSKIDSALGIPGFTNAVLVGIFTGNWASLAFALLSSFFGTRCQDPVKITREHIRLVLGQSLNAPNTPSQIATYRQEDVNYYSGLRDNGEIDLRLRNILYEKYGPVSTRVYKGMFTLPWSFDHIHIGY